MEQHLTSTEAKALFGSNFIGLEEIELISQKLNILAPSKLDLTIPPIPFSEKELVSKSQSHVLILLVPFDADGNRLSLLALRKHFGMDPLFAEPCFYNQDWYVNENFAKDCTINLEWRLISYEVINESKGQSESFVGKLKLPTALCCAYTFFAYYLLNNKILWPTNFIWCADKDGNGDRIYVGRYYDPLGIAKNGFSIHRHLRITPVYGCVDVT